MKTWGRLSSPAWVGRRYLLFTSIGAAGALLLAIRFNLGAAAIAAALMTSLGPTYLAWATFRYARAEAAVALDLDAIAGDLSLTVQRAWENEARLRRLHDPYPLPIAWQTGDPDLFEEWSLLCTLARAGPGGPPSDPAFWPADADGLAGSGPDITDVFSRCLPTRRLVVLGEPGAGKTVLLIRLLLGLLHQRPSRSPVPVLLSLASWDPCRQSLFSWVARQLRRAYPALTAAVPAPRAGEVTDLAQALLNSGRILPLLDGFDELPVALRARALDAINQALPPGHPVVLSSRTAEYRAAHLRQGTIARLNGAAGIRLLSLTPDQAATYLCRDAGGSHSPAAHRWHTVTRLLGTDAPVGQALSTPLGLFLARTIYNLRPGTEPDRRSHPDELCDTRLFPTRAHVEAHLLDAFVPSAYASNPCWSPAKARHTFAFLARHLEDHRLGSPDLSWWDLCYALSPRARRLLLGSATGCAFGLPFTLIAGIGFGLTVGVVSGLVAGVAGGVAGAIVHPPDVPGIRMVWSWPATTVGIGFGIVVTLSFTPMVGVVGGIEFGAAAALSAAFPFGIGVARPDLTKTVDPALLLTRDRRTFRIILLLSGVLGGLVGGITGGVEGRTEAGLETGLVSAVLVGFGVGFSVAIGSRVSMRIAVGLAFLPPFITGTVIAFNTGPGINTIVGAGSGVVKGLISGLVACLSVTAWGAFLLTRCYLAVSRQAPWRLMAFLRDAHHRGVLRQVGATYQFRHIELQRHLARPPRPPG
ncbi:NACHT domain-containing protein [Streptomyces sp. NPDC056486]|uniref:NACHT domain-containing protein n=1 Tax=Streptomyces sp. NPDC056486 TaxID=3345835 RepID=UPI0036C9719B